WWAPSKLREVVEAFEKNPDIGAVGHGYYRVDLINQKLESVVPERTCRLTLNNAAGARCFMALGGFLAPSMLAVRKRILDRIPPVPQELIFCGDAFIYTLAVAIGGAVVLDRPLSYYCVHGQNLFQTTDPERLRRRSEMTDRCWRELLPWLSKLGLARDANSMLTLAWRLDSEARCLSRQGGKRWRTFQNERARRRLAYRGGSLGYKVFKALSLGLTLLVPPPRFYQLKQWYARKGLGRMREKLGSPVSADLIGIRRHPVENLPSVLTGEISVSR
ncbi:MAG: hypothetical protein DMG21_17765, partial [Acidobacteria bacterium]